jgi:Rieske Fe-S protein
MLEEIRPPRRAVILGAGLGAVATAVAACGSSKSPAASSESPTSAPPSTGTSGTPKAVAIAKTADVPVGSGLIVDDVVLTQPTAGVFKGFSSVCTHAGCNVNAITDGKIACPCHGSEFNLDGTVAQGPAKLPLEVKAISVQGDSIIAG